MKPSEMRQVFAHIRKLVEKRHRVEGDQNRERPWQSVSSFLFLRFIVPAILHPHLFGIWPGTSWCCSDCPIYFLSDHTLSLLISVVFDIMIGLTEEPVQRSLTLIAKVIQSLANLNTVRAITALTSIPLLTPNHIDGPEGRLYARCQGIPIKHLGRHD